MAPRKSSRVYVKMNNGDTREAIAHFILGGLAVTRLEGVQNWTSVTHLTSGHMLFSTRTIVGAKEMANDFLALPIDWKKPALELAPDIAAHQEAIIHIAAKYLKR